MRFFKKARIGNLLTHWRAGLVLLAVLSAASFIVMGPVVTAESGDRTAVKVTVTADGQEWEWVSSQPTVSALLKEAGIALSPKDRVYPKSSAKVSQDMKIRVMRIAEKIVVQSEPIAFKTEYKFNPYGNGSKVLKEGERGEKEIKYLVTYKDGVKVEYKALEARILKKPINEVISISKPVELASRSGSVRSLRMIATAYAPFVCGGSRSGRTACGMRAGKGIVAVDPRVIRLGTRLYVDGYGSCVAGDTGGAIKGNRVDLGFNTYREAIRFGRRTVTVYILE